MTGLGLFAAAAVMFAGCVAIIVLSRRHRTTPAATPLGSDRIEARPALVNFVLNNCHPDSAAFDATILDLAARGFLAASSHPAGIWLAYTEPGTATAGVMLAGYERRVLDAMHNRLRNTGGAPFLALANACRVDGEGTWAPFTRTLRGEARRRGLCRRMLPLSSGIVTAAVVTVGAAAGFGYLAGHPGNSDGVGSTAYATVGAAVLVLGYLAMIGYRDRLTSAGSRLAASWKHQRAGLVTARASWGFTAPGTPPPAPTSQSLQLRAFAAAANVPGAGPGSVAIGRRRRQPADRHPPHAWSSFTGTWRVVSIEGLVSLRRRRAGWMIAAGAWFGLLASIFATTSGLHPTSNFVPVSAVLAVLALGLGIRGMTILAPIMASPRRATFDGQVIARWNDHDDVDRDEGDAYCVAVDDGTRAWTLKGIPANRAALEDLVRVSVNPRNGQILELTVTTPGRESPAPRKPGPPEVPAACQLVTGRGATACPDRIQSLAAAVAARVSGSAGHDLSRPIA